MFLLVPAYPGCPGSKAVKRSLLFVVVPFKLLAAFIKLNRDQDVMSQEVNVM